MPPTHATSHGSAAFAARVGGMVQGTIVVTGAAGAVGSALVRELASSGYAIAALDVRAAADRLAALAAELPGACIAVPGDVTSPSDWSAALARIERELGAPTGAALVAGSWQGGVPLHLESDDAVYRAMLAVNLDTVYRSLRALVPGMVGRRRGSIVVFGSRAVERPFTSVNASAYAAAKSAVVAMAQTVAAEVLESGVRINAVLPSTIDTPGNRIAMPDADPSRWVSVASLSRLVEFLVSDASPDISGAAIPIYGRA